MGRRDEALRASFNCHQMGRTWLSPGVASRLKRAGTRRFEWPTSRRPNRAGVPADIPAAVAGSDGHKDDHTRERAYLVWVDEGRPQGRELDHWLRAKWELEHEPGR